MRQQCGEQRVVLDHEREPIGEWLLDDDLAMFGLTTSQTTIYIVYHNVVVETTVHLQRWCPSTSANETTSADSEVLDAGAGLPRCPQPGKFGAGHGFGQRDHIRQFARQATSQGAT